jgi:hypothetical protein
MGKTKCQFRLSGVKDQGVVLRRSSKGELLYEQEGGGIREAILNRQGDAFYLFYDGWTPLDVDYKMCWNLRAKSHDLIHWEKQGVQLAGSRKDHPELKPGDCCDYYYCVSPWIIKEQDLYYMFYDGGPGQAPDSTPTGPYVTLLATGLSLEGPWHKATDEPGKRKHVCFPLRPGTFYQDTACAGHVLRNPKWQGDGDTENYKFMMFFSAASMRGELTRGIGIARTNDLSVGDDYNQLEGNFWHIDEQPLAPLEDDVENSSVYFEETTATWYLFTNHIDETNTYTDAIWVYWTQDLDCWNPANKAVVLDSSNSLVIRGAIGMPTVLKVNDETLAMVYDGAEGEDCSHMNRSICLATIDLPLIAPNCR